VTQIQPTNFLDFPEASLAMISTRSEGFQGVENGARRWYRPCSSIHLGTQANRRWEVHMKGAQSRGWKILGLGYLSWLLSVTVGTAAPLDLSDPTPRWIEVRFEISPHDAPGRLDNVWGAARRAYFEPDPGTQGVRIRIPGAELESQLRSTGTNPIRGTFSEFVWTLDAETGHVLRAELTGRVREDFRLGIFKSSTAVEIRVEMTTQSPAGYRPANLILGQKTHAFCLGDGEGNDCTLVQPMRFDPRRGYVNAVGSLRAETALARIQTFSPLGEVVFTESDSDPQESMASGRSSHNAVCSAPINGSCRPDLRGESS
jgi:hypothetical protein